MPGGIIVAGQTSRGSWVWKCDLHTQVLSLYECYSCRRGGSMSDRGPIVYIVDDDEVTRSYFDAVLSTANVPCCRVESASAFLDMYDPDQPGCLLLDVEMRSEEHTSELQSQSNLVCRLLLEKKKRDEE